MIQTRWLQAALACVLIALQTGFAQADPQVGWWWNPSESGRGFFIESQNGVIFLAGYFYEDDGRAKWLAAGGANADPNDYQGRLLASSGGQTLDGDYQPPNAPVDAGAVTVHFADATHGTFTWPGGTIAIERDIFGTGTASFQPESGWWWNPDESGRGFSIEVQGDKLFMVGFMYDTSGKPVWYFSAGAMSSPTRYTGIWQQFSGGQTMFGSYHPPSGSIFVGQVALEFIGVDEAMLTLNGSGPQVSGIPSSGSQAIHIQREFKRAPSGLTER